MKEGEIERLKDVIQKCFPELRQSEIGKQAGRISRNASFSFAFEQLNLNNFDPTKDIEALGKAANSLRLAQERLASVGLHGQRQLGKALKAVSEGDQFVIEMKLEPPVFARDAILEKLRVLQAGLEEARKNIDPNDVSFLSFTSKDDPKKFTEEKRKEIKALAVAEYCANLYYENTGTAPNRRNKTIPHPSSGQAQVAYGPFFNLVKGVFEALEITASVENFVKQAVMEFSPLNNKKAP